MAPMEMKEEINLPQYLYTFRWFETLEVTCINLLQSLAADYGIVSK